MYIIAAIQRSTLRHVEKEIRGPNPRLWVNACRPDHARLQNHLSQALLSFPGSGGSERYWQRRDLHCFLFYLYTVLQITNQSRVRPDLSCKCNKSAEQDDKVIPCNKVLTISLRTVNSAAQVQVQRDENYVAIRGFSDVEEGESGWQQDRFRVICIDRSLVCWTMPQLYARGERMKQLSSVLHFSVRSARGSRRGFKFKLSFLMLVITWHST